MVTLRSYSSPVEAAMAKSLLDDHGIVCALADENSNLYAGTGAIAIPIRLLVEEEQVDQARHVLDDTRQSLPDDLEPADSVADKTVGANQEFISELGRLRHTIQWIALGVIVILVLTIYLVSELPRRAFDPWREVYRARFRHDYPEAIRLTKLLIVQNPKDYYEHEYLGIIYW